MTTLGGIIRPGRRANQLAAYSQPLTAASGRAIPPEPFKFEEWSPNKQQTKKLGSFKPGETRQAARQNFRQSARQTARQTWRQGAPVDPTIPTEQKPPEMGYNPLGTYGEPAAQETEMQRTAHYKPAKVQALLDRKKKLLENHSQAWLDTWLAEAEPDMTGARGGPGIPGWSQRLQRALDAGDTEAIQALATKMGAKSFQQLIRHYSKPTEGDHVWTPEERAALEGMGFVVPVEPTLTLQEMVMKNQGSFESSADALYPGQIGRLPGETITEWLKRDIYEGEVGYGGATPEQFAEMVASGKVPGPAGLWGGARSSGATGTPNGGVQAATNKIKEQAALMGLPLTPEFEAQMRVYEDELSAKLAQLGIAQEQIAPMVALAMERMATQQGIDTSALREGMVERGIYDSGVTTRDWSRLNSGYAQQGQDVAMGAAQQYADIAAQQGEAYLNFQQKTIESLLQRALEAAQNVPLGLPQWGYDGVGADAATTRRARIRDRRQGRRQDRRAENA